MCSHNALLYYSEYSLWNALCFQSVQNKQESILQRLNDLDQENENFRCEIAELEEAKEQLEVSLTTAHREKEKLQNEVRKNEVTYVCCSYFWFNNFNKRRGWAMERGQGGGK